MNSDYSGKARRQLVKKVVFLFVLALVALAYVATPVLAACPNDNGGKDNNGNGGGGNGGGGNGNAGKNKKAKNPISAGNRQNIKEINDLKAGLNAGEKITGSDGAPKLLSNLKPGDKFTLSFSDGVVLQAVLDPGGKTATVTLTSGKQETCAPQANGTAIVTPKNGVSDNPVAVINSDKQTITQLRKSSLSGKLQLFRTNGTTPIKLSALQRVGQKFKIKNKENLLNAVYLGNSLARVTLVSGQRITIPLA